LDKFKATNLTIATDIEQREIQLSLDEAQFTLDDLQDDNDFLRGSIEEQKIYLALGDPFAKDNIVKIEAQIKENNELMNQAKTTIKDI
jgi:hypothetical protein